jgi:hypothetical protein
MSGANYYISAKQVMDSDRKIRAVSLLKFSGFSLADIDAAIQSGNNQSESSAIANEYDRTADDLAEQLSFTHVPEASDLNIIFYVAGYIARSVVRTTKCTSCKEALSEEIDADMVPFDNDTTLPYNATTFFDSINRGGLKKPTEFTFQLTCHCWTVYQEIRDCAKLSATLLSVRSQSTLFYKIMDRATCHHSVISCGLNNYFCSGGHDLTKFVVLRFFNCVAKNLVKQMTNAANPNQPERHRKIRKLTSKLSKS